MPPGTQPRPGHPPAWRLPAAVFAGGAAGGLARVGVVRATHPGPDAFPWPTFAINVVGTVLLGLLVVRLTERLPPSTFRRPLLCTGFCGALTTFSTVQVETIRLARGGHAVLAAGYASATIAAGFAGIVLATAAMRRTWAVR